MQIKFYGHACFSIKEGDVTVVTDPYDESVGLKLPAVKATVVTVSHKGPHHSNVKGVEGEPRAFDWPGEYETGGVHFRGITTFHNAEEEAEQLANTVFTMQFGDVRVCHLGSIGGKLTEEQSEMIGDVDVLLIPVGGTRSIGPKKAKEVIEQIEPRIIIPMLYATEGNKTELGTLEPFLTEMGAHGIEPLESFSLKRSELPDDSSKVVILQQQQ